MPAKILQFPNQSNPSDDDIAVLMRASIKKYAKRVMDNAERRAIMETYLEE
jgi:ubiquitin-protein ligase